MAKTFTVQVLTDKEFDSLPYKGIHDSMGIADPHKDMAFIRQSGVKEIDIGTLAHEVNHLIEKNGEHADEYGIMHKKGGVLRNIIPTLIGAVAAPFTGGASLAIPALLGAASSIGMNQYAQSKHPEQLGEPGTLGGILTQGITGAMSGYGGGSLAKGGIAGYSNAAKEEDATFMSKAGGALKGAFVGTAPTAAGTGSAGLLGSGGKLLGSGSLAPTGFQQGTTALSSSVLPAGEAAARAASVGNAIELANPAMSLLGGGIGNVAGLNITPAMSMAGGGVGNAAGQALPTLSLSGMANPASFSGIAAPSSNLLGGGTAQAVQPAAKEAAKAFSFKDLITPNNVIGAGSLMGAAGASSPEFQMPDSVEQLRQKIQEGQGLSPLGQQAQSELQNILKSSPQELYPTANNEYYNAALRRTRESYAEAEKQLDAAYNNAGMYGSGEHMAQKTKLKEELARTESGLYAQTEQRNFELARTEKYQAVQDALAVDKNTMDDLVGLTGLDVQTAAMLYGARVADVQAIREALGTVGMELLLKGNKGSVQSGGSING